MDSGYHKVFDFDNGWGASVVSNGMSYGGRSGLFEVMVLKNGEANSKNPVSGDYDSVVGFLDFAEVADVLKKIADLPKD